MQKNAKTSKKSKKKPGYLFDERMLLHRSNNPNDPETPDRASSIHLNLISKDLLKELEVIKTDYAKEDNILLVHSSKHVEKVNALRFDDGTNNKRDENSHGYTLCYDTFDNYYTANAASLACNSVIKAIDKVVKKKINGAFLVVRPPGYHAYPDLGSGFCFYNNVAIGAKYAIANHNLKRVAIVDWDVHHGNGTQDIFYESKDVLFISFHRFDKGMFYPYIKGHYSESGSKEGKGFNINIPFNTNRYQYESTVGDEEYVYAMETIVIPILKEFDPELILVSCGFDAAKGDPLGKCSISPFGYAYMVNSLKEIVGEKLIIVLEGGYNLKSLAFSSEQVVKSLLGQEIYKEVGNEKLNYKQFLSAMRPASYVVREINEIRKTFLPYWKSLSMCEVYEPKIKLFYKLDDLKTKDTLLSFLGKNYKDLFINSYKDIEDYLEKSSFISIKLGKCSFINKDDNIKYFKHLLVSDKSRGLLRGFRVENVCIPKYFIQWTKYDASYEFTEDSTLKLILHLCFGDFLKDLLNHLTKFTTLISPAFKDIGLDLINVSIIMICQPNGTILFKLNGIREYSLVQGVKYSEGEEGEFIRSLDQFIKFLM